MSTRTDRPYIDALVVALHGSEDDLRSALDRMDESALSRLLNAMNGISALAEQQRRSRRLVRGLRLMRGIDE